MVALEKKISFITTFHELFTTKKTGLAATPIQLFASALLLLLVSHGSVVKEHGTFLGDNEHNKVKKTCNGVDNELNGKCFGRSLFFSPLLVKSSF